MKIVEIAVAMTGGCRHHQNAFREAVGLTNSLEDGADFRDVVRRCQGACLHHFTKFGYPDAGKVIENELGE
ncbi:MAG: hypothetical protein HQ567_11025 [Candidatus Nealsonbacteria bacterium]|nr:hypothetical protein [Candidatus Nealsonbacteria bacterium]